jgi:hypothetical protein
MALTGSYVQRWIDAGYLTGLGAIRQQKVVDICDWIWDRS